MTITQVTKAAHVADAQGNLIEQFKGKTNFLAMIQAYVNQIGDLEAAAFEVLNETTLAASVGAQLDGIGEIVGEERLGRSDADYRQAISGRILINLSSGTIEDIAEIFNTLEPSNPLEVVEYPPASFMATLTQPVVGNITTLVNALFTSKPAGVWAALVYSLTNNFFKFAPDTSPLYDATNSFGTVSLLLNGDFRQWTADDPDDWTETETGTGEVTERAFDQGNAGSGNGACNLYSTGGDTAKIEQTFSVISGRYYRVSFKVGFAGSGDLRVQDTGGGTHFNQLYTSIGTGEQTIEFEATTTSITLDISAVDAVSNDITIGSVILHDVDTPSLAINPEFDRWTAGDADDWTETETAPDSYVTEVGSGQKFGESGVGSVNLYSVGGTGFGYVVATQQQLTLVPGNEYVIRLKISRVEQGTLFWGLYDAIPFDLFYESASQVGIYQTRFTATQANVDVAVATSDDNVTFVIPPSDITIDWLEVVELGTDTAGLFAGASGA